MKQELISEGSPDLINVQDYEGKFPVLCKSGDVPDSDMLLLYINKEEFISVRKCSSSAWPLNKVHRYDSFASGTHVVCNPGTAVQLTQ